MIRFNILLTISILIVLSSSCQNNNTRKIDTWSDGNPKTIIKYVNSKDTSDYYLIGFYESGDTNFIYSIRQNQSNGISKYFYENGQIKYLIDFKNDQFHGRSTFWYPNGQIWQIAKFVKGQLIDTLLDYYDNGNLKQIGLFKNGIGVLKYYHPNGELWKTGKTINGKEEGDWIYYYQNGSKKSEGTYKNGQRDGFYKGYYKTGELMESGLYKLNIITECTYFLKNGQIDQELTDLVNKHLNYIPWTEEQRKTLIHDCISDKLKIKQQRGDDYCYCMIDKLESFWSYADYLYATEIEYKELITIIDCLCEFE